MSEWQYAGRTGVDAGMILITDPCYVIGDKGQSHYEPYRAWDEFLGAIGDFGDLGDRAQITNQFGADIGVAITNFGGDGVFSVYVQVDETTGRVLAAQIRFDGGKPA